MKVQQHYFLLKVAIVYDYFSFKSKILSLLILLFFHVVLCPPFYNVVTLIINLMLNKKKVQVSHKNTSKA